jgi:hypothetical protein
LSPAFCDERSFAVFPNIWTWIRVNMRPTCGQMWAYIKLPPLYVLTGLLASDDDDELGNLAPVHPVLELRHDLLDVRLDLVVGGNWMRQWRGARHTGLYLPIMVRPYFLTLDVSVKVRQAVTAVTYAVKSSAG